MESPREIQGAPKPKGSDEDKIEKKVDPDAFKKLLKVDESDEAQKRHKRQQAEKEEDEDEVDDDVVAQAPPSVEFSSFMDEDEGDLGIFKTEKAGPGKTADQSGKAAAPSSDVRSTYGAEVDYEEDDHVSDNVGGYGAAPPSEGEEESPPPTPAARGTQAPPPESSQEQEPAQSQSEPPAPSQAPTAPTSGEEIQVSNYEPQKSSSADAKRKEEERKKLKKLEEAGKLPEEIEKAIPAKILKEAKEEEPFKDLKSPEEEIAKSGKIIPEKQELEGFKTPPTDLEEKPTIPPEKVEELATSIPGEIKEKEEKGTLPSVLDDSEMIKETEEAGKKVSKKKKTKIDDDHQAPVPLTEFPIQVINKTDSDTMGDEKKHKEESISPVSGVEGITTPSFSPNTVVTPSALPTHFSNMPQQVFDLFQKMVGLVTVHKETGIDTTTVTLNMPGSIFDQSQVVIEKYTTAANQINILLKGSPEAVNLMNDNIVNLAAAFEASKIASQVNIQRPILLPEYQVLSRKQDKGDDEQGRGRDQQQGNQK